MHLWEIQTCVIIKHITEARVLASTFLVVKLKASPNPSASSQSNVNSKERLCVGTVIRRLLTLWSPSPGCEFPFQWNLEHTLRLSGSLSLHLCVLHPYVMQTHTESRTGRGIVGGRLASLTLSTEITRIDAVCHREWQTFKVSGWPRETCLAHLNSSPPPPHLECFSSSRYIKRQSEYSKDFLAVWISRCWSRALNISGECNSYIGGCRNTIM